MAFIDKIRKNGKTFSLATPYCTCSTAANEPIKVITYDGLETAPAEGTSVKVNFTNANTAENPKLQINGTVFDIVAFDQTAPNTDFTWEAGSVIDFTYNGSAWVISNYAAVKEGKVWLGPRPVPVQPKLVRYNNVPYMEVSKAIDATTDIRLNKGYIDHVSPAEGLIRIEGKTEVPLAPLTATFNGKYAPPDGKLFNEITVAVPERPDPDPAKTEFIAEKIPGTDKARVTLNVITPGVVSSPRSTFISADSTDNLGTKQITTAGATDVVGYRAANVAAGVVSPNINITIDKEQREAIITPKAHTEAGYVNSGDKSGTAQKLAANDLVYGTYQITENGLGIDIAKYKAVDVQVATRTAGNHIFKQAATPTAAQDIIAGDLWYKEEAAEGIVDDSVNDYTALKWHRYNGTTWEEVTDGEVLLHSSAIRELIVTAEGFEHRISTSEANISELDNITATHSTSIAQNAKAITLKADTTRVNNIDGRVTDNSAQLVVQAEKIEARVTKTEYDENKEAVKQEFSEVKQTAQGIEQRVGVAEEGLVTHQAELNIHADEIEARVTNTTFNENKEVVNQHFSQVEQTAEGIQTQVTAIDKTVGDQGETIETHSSQITQQAGLIEHKVEQSQYDTETREIRKNVSTVTQTANKIELEVRTATGEGTTLSQKLDQITLQARHGNATYNQNTVPTGTESVPLMVGDLWYVNSTEDVGEYKAKKWYRYNGTGWDQLTDGEVTNTTLWKSEFTVSPSKISSEVGKVAGIEGKVSEHTSKIEQDAEKIALVVEEKSGGNVIKAASIITAIEKDGSQIKLDADRIKMQGGTIDMEANNFQIKAGNGFLLNQNGISWTTESSPNKMVYSQIELTKPADGKKYSEFPSVSTTDWHTIETAADLYASETTNAGATWSITRQIKGIDGEPGEPGASGYNTATINLYKRSTSAPSINWTNTLTYTFATKTLSPVPSGWSTTIPSGNDPIYVTAATAAANTSTDSIAYTEWATPVKLSANGFNSASVFIFKRSASVPTVPTATLTYTFSTGKLSGTLSGWSQTVPAADGNACYSAQASAISVSDTDTIATSEWSTPIVYTKDGAPGSSGKTIKTVRAYYAGNAFPSSKPTSKDLPSGWSYTAPALSPSAVFMYTSDCEVTDGSYGTWTDVVCSAHYGHDGSDATVNETNVFNVLTNGGTKFGVFGDSAKNELYINANYLKSGYINAARIDAGTIVAAKLATDAVTTDKIAANAITAGKVKAGELTVDKFKAGELVASNITLSSSDTTTVKSSLSSKTPKNAVIATINASTEGVTIAADKITLDGNVVMKSNLTDGTTQISGDNITTGTIKADYIDAANLKIAAGNVSGTLTIGTQIPKDLSKYDNSSSGYQNASQVSSTASSAASAAESSAKSAAQGYANTAEANAVKTIEDKGYQTETGVTSIVKGVVTTDYVNALGITTKKLTVTKDSKVLFNADATATTPTVTLASWQVGGDIIRNGSSINNSTVGMRCGENYGAQSLIPGSAVLSPIRFYAGRTGTMSETGDNAGKANFIVTDDGSLYAQGAAVSGDIKATALSATSTATENLTATDSFKIGSCQVTNAATSGTTAVYYFYAELNGTAPWNSGNTFELGSVLKIHAKTTDSATAEDVAVPTAVTLAGQLALSTNSLRQYAVSETANFTATMAANASSVVVTVTVTQRNTYYYPILNYSTSHWKKIVPTGTASVIGFVVSGNVLPSYNATAASNELNAASFTLGTSSFKWAKVYALEYKTSANEADYENVEEIDNKYSSFFDNLKPITYTNPGDSKVHFGLTGQDVERALVKANLDSEQASGLVKSYNEGTNSDNYDLCYDEFVSLLIKEVQTLKSRVAELEEKLNK